MRRIVGLAVVASLALGVAEARAAETIYVDDPLTSKPTGGMIAGVVAGTKGGTFGTEGWTTTGDEDAIWFLIPATLPTVRIEVSVKGITNAVLDGEEHDILVTYGDTDRPEPVDYAPAYRNNAFKTNLRIFGSASVAAGGRPVGSNKLELRLCPAGPPGHHDGCPAGCTDVFEVGYLGGPPESIPWDAATTYRLAIGWSPGTIKYTRGIEPAVTIGYPGTLAPKELRVRIGSPRHGAGSVNRMPKGLTFKNLIIGGEPGTPTPICTVKPDAGVTPPDASVPIDAGCDATKPLSTQPLEVIGGGDPLLHRATYVHCGGAASLRIVQFFVADAVDVALPHLTGSYEAGRLSLGTDSCAPGEAKVLTAPNGSLDCARTKVTSSGDRIVVDWALRIDATLGASPRSFWVDSKGTGTPEPRLGWTKIGTFGAGPVAVDAGVPDASTVADASSDAARGEEDLGGGELGCLCGVPRAPRRHDSVALFALAVTAFVVRRRARG